MKGLVVINADTHELAKDTEGNIVVENNRVLATHKLKKNSFYLPVTPEIRKIFGFSEDEMKEVSEDNVEENPTEAEILKQEMDLQETEETEKSGYAYKWNNNATERLLALYRQNRADFTSSTIKRDVAFARITQIMQEEGFPYTTFQCRDRFKYLKKVYMRAKNNGSNNFPYSSLFDEILNVSNDNNVESSVVVASTSRILGDEHDYVESEEETIRNEEQFSNTFQLEKRDKPESNKRKRKRTAAAEEPDDPVERRHREKLALQREAIDVFKMMMTKLIQKL